MTVRDGKSEDIAPLAVAQMVMDALFLVLTLGLVVQMVKRSEFMQRFNMRKVKEKLVGHPVMTEDQIRSQARAAVIEAMRIVRQAET